MKFNWFEYVLYRIHRCNMKQQQKKKQMNNESAWLQKTVPEESKNELNEIKIRNKYRTRKKNQN